MAQDADRLGVARSPRPSDDLRDAAAVERRGVEISADHRCGRRRPEVRVGRRPLEARACGKAPRPQDRRERVRAADNGRPAQARRPSRGPLRVEDLDRPGTCRRGVAEHVGTRRGDDRRARHIQDARNHEAHAFAGPGWPENEEAVLEARPQRTARRSLAPERQAELGRRDATCRQSGADLCRL